MRREPEVPEASVPVVECLDVPARITSKELAQLHSVKNGILRSACSTKPTVVVGLGKSGLVCAHRQVDEQPTKRSKKYDDKSAEAMLKKSDWHEDVRELVVNHVESHDRSGCSYAHRQVDGQPWKKSKKNGDKSAVAILKNTRQLGCVFSRYGAAEVLIDFAEELKHTDANPMCSIH